jgi:hypothetical protein
MVINMLNIDNTTFNLGNTNIDALMMKNGEFIPVIWNEKDRLDRMPLQAHIYHSIMNTPKDD